MKHLVLTTLTVWLTLTHLAVQAQDIRAVGDRIPTAHKTAVAVTPATYKGRQIVVGSGGGFTGFSSAYYLLDNGKLFGRRSRDTTFTFIRQQTTARTRQMFGTVEGTCKIRKTKFDYPGNLYKFVQWRKDKVSHKVTWGASSKQVGATYPKFYDSFMIMIPASARLN